MLCACMLIRNQIEISGLWIQGLPSTVLLIGSGSIITSEVNLCMWSIVISRNSKLSINR